MLDKRFDIIGLLGIILLSGIIIQSAFADVRFSGDIDLNCPTQTFAEFSKTVAFLEMCPIDFPVQGGGSGGGIQVGGQQSISQLSDIEPPTVPAPPEEIDRVFSLFDQLNSFFAPTEPVTQDTPVEDIREMIIESIEVGIPDIEEIISETTTSSFFDSIRSFFSSLFG